MRSGVRHHGGVGGRGRPWWAALVLAVPVALLLAGLWKAIALFAAVCAGLVAPVLVGQWWSRRRQRAANVGGAQVWDGHLALDCAAGLWEFGVGSAFLFGAGVPVCLAPQPLGLLVELRRSRLRRVAARRRAAVRHATARRAPARPTPRHGAAPPGPARPTAGRTGAGPPGAGGADPGGGAGQAPILVSWTDIAAVRQAGPTRMTDWGRAGVLPFDVVEVVLHDGGVLPFATPDATGLADLITLRSSAGTGSGAG
ncbi:hypothetical protein Dsi01nite_063900 [Dactylosporangium siamense]|uniref:Uncharacterized protein n=1 Tax=Dactylosporangium siamense TaxID=685454 RepID=A0A919PQR3_9ACTN|nr:hypothetical protein Dsi01nite_063900 [Dactylosporangium siamense]